MSMSTQEHEHESAGAHRTAVAGGRAGLLSTISVGAADRQLSCKFELTLTQTAIFRLEGRMGSADPPLL